MKVFFVLGIIARDSLKITADIPQTANVVFIVCITRSAMYYVYTVNFFAYSSHRREHTFSLTYDHQSRRDNIKKVTQIFVQYISYFF